MRRIGPRSCGSSLLSPVKPEIGPDLFRRPVLSGFIQEAGLNDALAKKLVDILEDQCVDAANKYLHLLRHVSEILTYIDDQSIFYLDQSATDTHLFFFT